MPTHKTAIPWQSALDEVSAAPGRRSTGDAFREFLRSPLSIVVSLTLAVAIWEAASTWLFNPQMIPPPSLVLKTALPMISSGEILESVGISMIRVLVGFVIGSLGGIVVGIAMGRSFVVNRLIDPVIEVMRYLSPTAMIPIAIIWFGIGESSKYFLIFWGSFFSVLLNTTSGVMRLPVGRERAARCLGEKGLGLILKVVLPSALPDIVVGMRLAMSLSLMAIVPAEMLAADSGIGYLLQASGMLAQTNRIFVALVTISLLGFVLDFVFRWIVRRTMTRYLTS
jgi:NitT/TauT family transport system permease protein/taurine transport system permease protein